MNVNHQDIIDNTILRGAVGSKAHGLNLEGTDEQWLIDTYRAYWA